MPSRTPTQVASHAQKYFVRLLDANSNSNERKKKRKKSSVFDLRIEKTEDTDQAMVPLGNNQETHNVANYMMKSVPTVMPLTWVHMNPHNDHYASSHNLGFVRILLLRIITLSKRCSQENI